MNISQEAKEKTCIIYASDYHFEMITLPYISKKIELGEEVVIITENNLEETIKEVVSKINLKEKNRKNILSIDWNNNNNVKKLEKIKNNLEEEKNTVVFIKGEKNYIQNINKNINKWTTGKDNLKIVDCFDLADVTENIDVVMDKYGKILNTSGEKKIN